jgi:hypothetical protein
MVTIIFVVVIVAVIVLAMLALGFLDVVEYRELPDCSCEVKGFLIIADEDCPHHGVR